MLFIPLATVLFVEFALALLLLTPWAPVRKAGLRLVAGLKGTVGSVIVRTLCGFLVVLLLFSFYIIRDAYIRKRKDSSLMGNSAYMGDHCYLLEETLEAFMMAFCLLAAVLIQHLQFYMKSSDSLKTNLETLKKQAKGLETEYKRLQSETSGEGTGGIVTNDQVAALKARVNELKASNEKLQVEADSGSKAAKTAEASVQALKKQAEGLRIEYNRALDENDSLRAQLASLDRTYTRSDDKKRS